MTCTAGQLQRDFNQSLDYHGLLTNNAAIVQSSGPNAFKINARQYIRSNIYTEQYRYGCNNEEGRDDCITNALKILTRHNDIGQQW